MITKQQIDFYFILLNNIYGNKMAKLTQVKDEETSRNYCHPKDIIKAIGYIPYAELTDDEIRKSYVGDVNDSTRTHSQRIRSFMHLIQTKQMWPTWNLIIHETSDGYLDLEDGNHRLRAYLLCDELVPVKIYQLG